MCRSVKRHKELETRPVATLDEALIIVNGGAQVIVETDDDIVVMHYQSSGEIAVMFPQLRLLSPGMLERSLPMLYRQLMMERAGTRQQATEDAKDEINQAFLVGPLEGSDEATLAEATSATSGGQAFADALGLNEPITTEGDE